MASISKRMRRDRELAFYGDEDFVPSEFYEESDATLALQDATTTVDLVEPHILL